MSKKDKQWLIVLLIIGFGIFIYKTVGFEAGVIFFLAVIVAGIAHIAQHFDE